MKILIVEDDLMPVLNGLELIQRIRAANLPYSRTWCC